MSKNNTLKINEIFFSIQGESSFIGLPCIFVRLTFCNLRCVYCDTEYAFYDGQIMEINDIITEVSKYDCKLIEITGGEPLIQESVHELIRKLCDKGYNVLLETGGSLSIKMVDKRVKIIMDVKTPFSNMSDKNDFTNLEFIKDTDEIKFVIGDREDYEWAKNIINKYDLSKKCIVLMSTVFDKLSNLDLSTWILEDSLKVRFQTQLHKLIWNPETRGV